MNFSTAMRLSEIGRKLAVLVPGFGFGGKFKTIGRVWSPGSPAFWIYSQMVTIFSSASFCVFCGLFFCIIQNIHTLCTITLGRIKAVAHIEINLSDFQLCLKGAQDFSMNWQILQHFDHCFWDNWHLFVMDVPQYFTVLSSLIEFKGSSCHFDPLRVANPQQSLNLSRHIMKGGRRSRSWILGFQLLISVAESSDQHFCLTGPQEFEAGHNYRFWAFYMYCIGVSV